MFRGGPGREELLLMAERLPVTSAAVDSNELGGVLVLTGVT